MKRFYSYVDRRGVPLIAVLHEKLGSEEFQQFFSGPLYYDQDKTFFGGEHQRRLGLLGFLRLDVWLNIYKSVQAGTDGNMKGDGTLLGGVYVLGKDDQGVLYHHQEVVWGDHFNKTELLEAVNKINKSD